MKEEYQASVVAWLLDNCFVASDVIGVSEIHRRAKYLGWAASISTTRRHLYFAAQMGLLNRAWGWTGKRQGWVFALPETMPTLIDLMEWSGQDNPEEAL